MESKQHKPILISCGVIIVVACLCLIIFAFTGAGVVFLLPFEGGEISRTQITVTVEPPNNNKPESPIEQNNELPDELAAAMAAIESEVVAIRGLIPTKAVKRTLITKDELRQIVIEDFFADYSDQDVRKDDVILSTLGLLPNEFDLKNFYEALYTEQISGFYDDEEKAMYVVSDQGFAGAQKLTYAHEYTHVLQDQIYDLRNGLGLNEESCEVDTERCAAVQALIEGDASLTEILWFQTYATEEDYDDLIQFYEVFESPILDSAPPYMAADLFFPYEKGQVFVQLLYNRGGFSAVDEVYENPPVSTEQLLHPERYPEDVPQIVELPDLEDVLGPDWKLYDQNVMGEWYTLLILHKAYEEDYQLDEKFAQNAAQGWGGDAYAFYLNENTGEVVFILDTTWDTERDADEFKEAFESYADLRWEETKDNSQDFKIWSGSEGVILFENMGDRTLWVLAPDLATGELIYSTLR